MTEAAWWTYPLLFAAGVVVSVINSVSGGGSILSLPLLIFLGLPSAAANGTNRIGALAGSLGSLAAFRRLGHFHPRLAWQVGWPASLGSLVGSLLAVRLPDRIFNPVLAAVILFVAVMSFRKRPAAGQAREPASVRSGAVAFLIYAGIGFYGGFIQAGSGLLMIYAFGRLGNLDIFQINSLKMFNTFLFISVSILVFAAAGRIHWGMAVALAAGNVVGGWMGSHLQVRRGEAWVNRFVLATGILMAARLVWTTFRP
ncbi:MAG TPA: sulfite exporter TauE/SafE family protein [Fibrobacteria bacterium]|nr:sulfite exporter TauE/SafE family protein [Fibrobacteria bacterium]